MDATLPPAGPRPPRKYLYLLVSISTVVCVFPFAHESLFGIVLLQLLFLAMMGAAVLAVRRSGRHKILALGLGAVAIAARLVSLLYPASYAMSLFLTACGVVFFFWVLIILMMDVFTGTTVSGDKICGAICVYFIIGLSWSIFFGFLELAAPGSFLIPGITSPAIQAGLDSTRAALEGFPAEGPQHIHTMEGSFLTYFSFITLTSVGYGDVIPASHAARTFSWVEAVVGQLYIAILVARLVGLQLVERTRQNG